MAGCACLPRQHAPLLCPPSSPHNAEARAALEADVEAKAAFVAGLEAQLAEAAAATAVDKAALEAAAVQSADLEARLAGLEGELAAKAGDLEGAAGELAAASKRLEALAGGRVGSGGGGREDVLHQPCVQQVAACGLRMFTPPPIPTLSAPAAELAASQEACGTLRSELAALAADKSSVEGAQASLAEQLTAVQVRDTAQLLGG